MFNQNKHNVKVVLLINDVIYISEVIVQTITQLNDYLSQGGDKQINVRIYLTQLHTYTLHISHVLISSRSAVKSL